jgi:radical SAM superfamily enzyme YgiQ (UPF0313 family)
MRSTKILITEDSAAMSDYHQNIYLGFVSCIPDRVVPRFLYRKLFIPQVPADLRGTVECAPLPLRAVESILLNGEFKRDDVSIIRSDYLERRIGDETRIVALSSHDPLGLGPATTTWATIFGGEPHNRLEFQEQMARILKLKAKFDFKVVLGGSGSWQLLPEKQFTKYGIDYLFMGEAEYVLPELFQQIADDCYDGPRIIQGRITRPEDAPIIEGPTNWALVEISRGCGRGCFFCAPNTSGKLRSIPLDTILENAKTNLEAPYNVWKYITLHSDDSLRYGSNSKDARVNPDAVYELYDGLFDLGAKSICITHATLANLVADEEFIVEFTRYLNRHGMPHYGCQPGLESGSPRIMGSMMKGKMRPYAPEEWPWVVENAFRVMHENTWYSVSTLIMGLPGEAREDISDTYKLIERIDEYHSLYIPLFFVPMNMTRLENRRKFIADMMTKEHWRLLELCWEHNLKHIYSLYSMADIKSPVLLRAFVWSGVQALKGIIKMYRNQKISKSKRAPTLEELNYVDPMKAATQYHESITS